jgi:cellulose synthase/poly-beta-1,6-N-acetylglucosamine synthase-like glycosyltransferase
LRPFYFEERRGKMLTLNDLVAHATGEILFFVDADIIVNPDALLKHVRHYADPAVGAVGGDIDLRAGQTSGIFEAERNFWNVDRALRQHEAKINSAMALYGGNFTMRRSLWRSFPLAGAVHDDFFSVLSVCAQNKRVLFDSEAIVVEYFARDVQDEFRRKRRNASFSLRTIQYFPSILFRPATAWMIWPHKVLRWFSGFLMILWTVGTVGAFSTHSTVGQALFILWCAFIVLAAFGALLPSRSLRSIPYRAWWLLYMNAASIAGVFEYLLARKDPRWAQSTRAGATAA